MNFQGLFPIETKSRDFDSRLYLALCSIKNIENFDFTIGKKSAISNYINNYKGKDKLIFFSKGDTKSSIIFLEKIKKRNGIIIILDEEGGPSKKNEKLFLKRYPNSILKLTDIIFCWGNKQKEIIIRKKKKHLKNTKLFVTGHPRFDIKKRNMSKLFLENNTDKKRKYILFNLNFGLCNSHLNFDEMLVHQKQMHKELRNNIFEGFSKRELDLKFNYQKKLRRCFIDIIIKLSKKLPEVIIYVRPHPSEDPSSYIKIFKTPNIIIDNKCNVQEQIIESNIVIHHDCTTAIESFFYGKNIISFDPIKNSDFINKNLVNQLPKKISTLIINSDKELFSKVEMLLSNDEYYLKSYSSKKKLIEEYFENINYNSAEKISQLLKNEIKTKEGSENLSINISNVNFLPSLKIKKRQKINSDNFKKRYHAKFPGIDLNEIKEKIEIIRDLDKGIPPVKIDQIDDNLFKIVK